MCIRYLIFDTFQANLPAKNILSFLISSRIETLRNYFFICYASLETQKIRASPETKALNTWY